MKKAWLIIAGAIVVLAGIGTAAVLAGKQDGSSENSSPISATNDEHGAHGHLGKKDACDYLTQDVADSLLGTGSQRSTQNADKSSGDMHVSTCTYTSKTEISEEVRNIRTVSLLLRAPLTEAGAESNEKPFLNPPEGAQDVSNYGEKAYWDTGKGQLNILKDGAWLIMTSGKSISANRTLDDAKKLADILTPAYNKH